MIIKALLLVICILLTFLILFLFCKLRLAPLLVLRFIFKAIYLSIISNSGIKIYRLCQCLIFLGKKGQSFLFRMIKICQNIGRPEYPTFLTSKEGLSGYQISSCTRNKIFLVFEASQVISIHWFDLICSNSVNWCFPLLHFNRKHLIYDNNIKREIQVLQMVIFLLLGYYLVHR